MANHMAEVAKMLGVELGEKFKISLSNGYVNDHDYYFAENGIYDANTGYYVSSALLDLVTGISSIKRKLWKPSLNDDFWFIDVDGVACKYCNFDNIDADHVNYYKIGNCYRTREETEANRDKWVKFYASDEVLEV